jgi:oxygen-independent coproporphyrinogen-3 oxidase
LADAGLSRISLGVQSFDDHKLKLLERDHRAADISRAFGLARDYAQSVSLDLIFGTPGESLESWNSDLEAALQLAPDHVSTYGLTFEKGTDFGTRLDRGELEQLEEETEAQMYEAAIDRITSAGLQHYEVSNFARPGHRCRHNEAYWLGEPYYAVGPGAARYLDGRREMNHRSTTTYLRRVLAGESPIAETETLSAADSARERLVFGLRRLEGIDRASFETSTGQAINALVGDALQKHVRHGLLEDDGHRIRLTRRGLLVSDSIWPDFLRV